MNDNKEKAKYDWKKRVKEVEKIARKTVKERNAKTKVFVDSEGRFLGNSTMSNLAEVADFSLWHMPFDDVMVVGADSIVRLVAGVNKEGGSLHNIGGINAVNDSGEAWRGIFHIGKEWPNIDGDFSHALPMQIQLSDGYYIYLIVESISGGMGKVPPTSINDTWLQDFVIQTASHAIMYFADFCVSPKYFVVEISPARRNKNRTKRMAGKSVYSVIHIKDIRKRYIPQERGNTSRIGHERRRHTRTYRHHRYVNMQGQTVIIDSTWIGPKSAYHENRIYRVLTDLM